MTKLVVGIVMTILVLGGCIYAMGTRIIPEIGNAGNAVKASITQAFQ